MGTTINPNVDITVYGLFNYEGMVASAICALIVKFANKIFPKFGTVSSRVFVKNSPASVSLGRS